MANKAFSRSLSVTKRLLVKQLRTNSSKYLNRKSSNLSLKSKYRRHSSFARADFLENTTVICNIENGLLKSSNVFPYFMLVAFEAGSILRALILLLIYPLMFLVKSEEIRLKMMVMVCFCGIKKGGFRIGASVLPKFLLENVGLEGFEVMKKTKVEKKIGVSDMPQVMIECFLRDYMGFDGVVGRELKVFHGYFTGLMEDKITNNMSVDDTNVVVGISSCNSSVDRRLVSSCDEIFLTNESERSSWKQLPREKYPEPLIFHDGRLAFRPTAFSCIAMFMWFPFGFLLAIVRGMIALLLPYSIGGPLLAFSGLSLELTSNSHASAAPKSKGILYVCNHRTLLDPLYLSFSLKKNLTAVTYSLSRLSEILAPIKTVRLTRSLSKDSKLMDQMLTQGDLVVCPEGTTCREPYLLRFSPLFTEMSETIVPVAMDSKVSMFHGTTAGGLKCLDPLFFLMNPFPSYYVKFLDQVEGLSSSKSTDGATGRDSRRFDIANQVQSELGKTLHFESTKLTRKDKYLVLAGNEGVVPQSKNVKSE
ncbi:unnamed protein product [Rhodiola kirilowii]